MPAAVHGLVDRGVLRQGAAADLLVIDASRLRAGATRLVRDLPAGSGRYVVDAEGYVAVVVNGVVLLAEGRHTGGAAGAVRGWRASGRRLTQWESNPVRHRKARNLE